MRIKKLLILFMCAPDPVRKTAFTTLGLWPRREHVGFCFFFVFFNSQEVFTNVDVTGPACSCGDS